jgi:hypothetical protein
MERMIRCGHQLPMALARATTPSAIFAIRLGAYGSAFSSGLE